MTAVSVIAIGSALNCGIHFRRYLKERLQICARTVHP
jgi:hypothetical protein